MAKKIWKNRMPSRQKVFILISFRIQIAFWLLSFLEIYVISLLNGDPQKRLFSILNKLNNSLLIETVKLYSSSSKAEMKVAFGWNKFCNHEEISIILLKHQQSHQKSAWSQIAIILYGTTWFTQHPLLNLTTYFKVFQS